MKKLTLTLLLAITGIVSFSQIEELTPEEKFYRDSIMHLNESNAAIEASQTAYNEGIELFKQKKYKGAVGKFSTSISNDPKFTPAYYNKAVAENMMEDYKAAIKTIDALLKIKSNYAKAYFQRGKAYQGLEDFLNAEKDYQKAIELDPKNPKAYYNFGTLKFLHKGNYA